VQRSPTLAFKRAKKETTMYRSILGLALAVVVASAAPVFAEEAPVYVGDYNPPVVRTGHDSRIGDASVSSHSGARDISDPNGDAAPGGYSANVDLSDIYSGR
jgi:hypothetical protein